MAHVISDECVSCGACEAECPVGAISQGADHYEIDADACVDCGACAAQCPTGAISQANPRREVFLRDLYEHSKKADCLHLMRAVCFFISGREPLCAGFSCRVFL